MALFRISSTTLTPVSEKKIDLERDIQRLTEQNLETVFGLTFVSGALNQEFSVRVQEQDFYVDTLAFDEEHNSFVIIEYKKDRSFSVIDQGFAYLSAMLNHKADFVLELNERLKRNLMKKDIDWEQSRIIFVSPEFTNYQRNAINFKDLPIFLYEVTPYEDNIIEYNPIKPYRTSESIDSLTKDTTIRSVSEEVKVYSEEDLIPSVGLAKELYPDLKEKILAIDSTLIFHPTKTYIGVQTVGNWRMIAALNIRQNQIIIDYTRSEPGDFSDPLHKVLYKKNSMKHFNQHISTFVVESLDDTEYAADLFRQAYNRFKHQFGK